MVTKMVAMAARSSVAMGMFVVVLIGMASALDIPCPTYCRCYQDSTIIHCSGLQLTQMPLIPSSAKELYLDRNKLKTIQNNSFKNLDKLEYLNMEKNEIISLEQQAFHGLNNLKTLKLGKNRLMDLHLNLFRIPRRLTHLDLSGNRFKRLPDGSMVPLDQLEHLNMSYNQISFPKLGAGFKSTTKLKVLDLSHNNFGEIQQTTFESMLWWSQTSIHLNLSYCNIHNLHNLTFSQHFNLGELILSGNKGIPLKQLKTSLSRIEGEGSTSLKVLDLSNMNISDPGALLGDMRFTGLETLDMSHNAISIVKNRPFRNLLALKSLDLSHNILRTTGDLQGLSSLTKLVLSYNYISAIDQLSMEAVNNLKELYVSHNHLKAIDDESLEDLFDLSLLDVSYNEIKTFNVISALEQLEFLYVQFNSLNNMGSIPKMQKLKTLDISQNQLKTLGADMFSRTSRMEIVNFSRNAIRDISNNTFKSYTPHIIDLSFNNISRLQNYGWTTVLHLFLQGNKIASISSDALKGLHWLKKLDMSFNKLKHIWSDNVLDLDSLEELYLGRNDLGGLVSSQNGAELLAKLSKLKVLNLSTNRIQRLHPRLLEKSFQLEKLDISVNNLQNLTFINPQQLASLQELVISHNKMNNIDPKRLKELQSLRSADLSYNPFYCSCDLVPFREWIRKTHVEVVSFDLGQSYRCNKPGKYRNVPLRQFNMTGDDCKSGFDKRIIFIAIGGLGLIIVIIGGILFYRHRWRIKRKLAHKQQYGIIHQNDTLHLQQQQLERNGNGNGNGNPSWI